MTWLLLMMAGCIPLPFVSPPSELSFAVGGASRGAPPPDNWAGIGSPIESEFRAGLYPAGVRPDLALRPVDAGAGYMAIFGPSGAFTHGGYGEFRMHPFVKEFSPLPKPGVMRLVLSSSVGPLYNPSAGWGFGASVGVSFEAVQFVEGEFASGDIDGAIFGAAYGEAGGGAGLEMSMRHVPGYTWGSISVRFRGRLPASAGLALIPIY